MSRPRTALLALVALAAGALSGAAIVLAGSPDPAPVLRTPLAETADPAGAAGRTLGLSRVTVAPGATLPLHRHPGVQVAYLARGVLTYSVLRGAVAVRTGPAGDAVLVRRIRAGQTGRIRAGQWIVERPGTIHHAANRGATRIVIWLATLFRTGAPPAIPVATPDRR